MVKTPGEIWTLLRKVNDPEIPVLNVVEMGVVHDARPLNEGWEVEITPTYSGCPAGYHRGRHQTGLPHGQDSR